MSTLKQRVNTQRTEKKRKEKELTAKQKKRPQSVRQATTSLPDTKPNTNNFNLHSQKATLTRMYACMHVFPIPADIPALWSPSRTKGTTTISGAHRRYLTAVKVKTDNTGRSTEPLIHPHHRRTSTNEARQICLRPRPKVDGQTLRGANGGAESAANLRPFHIDMIE